MENICFNFGVFANYEDYDAFDLSSAKVSQEGHVDDILQVAKQ